MCRLVKLDMSSQIKNMKSSKFKASKKNSFKNFNEVVILDLYMKCENKLHKTWYSLIIDVFFGYM